MGDLIPPHREFSMGFRIVMEEVEDYSQAGELLKLLEQRQVECQAALADIMLRDIYGPEEPPVVRVERFWVRHLIRPVGRLRRWLGWKVWRVAGWLNPDVYD